jgi:hypothetical protein
MTVSAGQSVRQEAERASDAQSKCVTCTYVGGPEMIVRGAITGNFYHLRFGERVTVDAADWPVLQRVWLLQRL